jgi:hypothetical protein
MCAGDKITPREGYLETIDFLTFSVETINSTMFQPPARCTEPPQHCNASGVEAASISPVPIPNKVASETPTFVKNVTHYIAHPLENTGQLSNQNTGDLLGDITFLVTAKQAVRKVEGRMSGARTI